jgi:hypothetical protein
MSKLNNLHFGRPVFEYFPWNKYSNNLLDSPELDKGMYKTFVYAFDSESDSATNPWITEGQIKYITSKGSPMRGTDITLKLVNNIAYYCGISETVYDWEDVEKIRLRILLGTESKAKNYIRVIDSYHKYYDKISDAIYSDTGREIPVKIINFWQYIFKEDDSLCKGIIEPEDVYQILLNNDYKDHKFLSSVKSYFIKNKMLTERQIEAVKDILYKPICKQISDNIIIFSAEKIKGLNFSRISNYLNEVGLMLKKNGPESIITYKHYGIIDKNIF